MVIPPAAAAKLSAAPLVGLGGVAMSAQSSVGGVSDAGGGGGGVAMSRNGNGSSMGLTTKRSASGAGFVNGEGGKRIRSR